MVARGDLKRIATTRILTRVIIFLMDNPRSTVRDIQRGINIRRDIIEDSLRWLKNYELVGIKPNGKGGTGKYFYFLTKDKQKV